MKNKTAIITGAASGIGRAIAIRFADEGYHVHISDINAEGLEKVSAKIKIKGNKCTATIADSSKFQNVDDLVRKAYESEERLDVMINNAGIGPKNLAPTGDYTFEDWHDVIAVNQTGVFYGMKSALQVMRKQGFGNIINIASLAGLKASPNNISYSASKFAVVGMTKSAAMEYGKKNIRINAICPGYTESNLLGQLIKNNEKLENTLKTLIPFDRFGKAEEIAAAAYWLASDESSYMTGQAITLDGGISL